VLRTEVVAGSPVRTKWDRAARGGFYAEISAGSVCNAVDCAVRGDGNGPGCRGRCWSWPRAGSRSHGLRSPGLRLGLLLLLPLRLRPLRLLRAGMVQ
jgi:hypothetical protein